MEREAAPRTVSDAVRRRMSVRAFLPEPVPADVIRAVLDDARRSPSGGNLQPWRIDVVAGNRLEALKALMAERVKAGAQETPEYPVYPPDLWEPHRSHRYAVGEALFALRGVAREDKAGRRRHLESNYQFFGAPLGLFFSLDRRFGAAQWADLGIIMQTIMLLLVERGLGSCAQESWSFWPDTVGSFLGMPQGHILFAGMAVGYADPAAGVNKLRSDRAKLNSIAVFHGFAEDDERETARFTTDLSRV